PAIRPHTTVTLEAEAGRGFARHQISDEFSIPHQWRAGSGHSFVVPSECSETCRVNAVGREIDDVRTVAEIVSLVRRQETASGESGFSAEHAIQLRGMTARFMNL